MISRLLPCRFGLMLAGLLLGLSLLLAATVQAAVMTVDDEIAQRIRQNLKLTIQERQWLQAHPTIRVGIDAGYAPYSEWSEEGRFVGVAPDYLKLLSASLGIKFEAVPGLAWHEIVTSAKQKQLDLIATAVVTPERQSFLDFTRIYLPTPLVIMTRRDQSSIVDASHLSGKRVALVKSYSSSGRVMEEHPDIIAHDVETPLEGLQALAAGEVDAYIGVLGVNFHLAQTQGLTNLKIAGRYDLKHNGQRFAVRKDWPELRGILDKALNLMTLQDHNTLMNRWVPMDATGMVLNYTQAAPLTWTAEEKAWLAQHPRITVGAMADWPPMDYVDENGEPIGIGAEFVAALNSRLNGVLNIVPGDWETIYSAAQEKKLDALIGITPLKEREPYFNFTRPYVRVPHVIFARKGTEYLSDLNALKGKTVALERGFFLRSVLIDRYPQISVLEFDTTSDALDAVIKGQADAYIGNRAVAMYIIHNELIANLEEHGKIKETASVNAIGVRKDWPMLQTILQKALDNITVKERLAILQGWVEPTPLGDIEGVELTVDEWAWLDNHPVIRLAGDPNWTPVEFRDQNGEYKGVAAEYLNLLSQLLGVRFEYDKHSSWIEAVDKVQQKQLDMFAAAASTPAREKYAAFTEPYLSLPAMVFTRDNVGYISGMELLETKKVAVVRGYAIAELIRRGGWNLELVEVDSVEQGLELLQQGKVYAYVGSILVTSHYLRERGYANIRVSGQTPYTIDVSMGVRNDWPVLKRILDKALARISDTQKHNIEARWVGVQIKQAPDYSLFWQLLAAGLVILGLFLIWNAFLQRKSARQSLEIREQNRSLRQSQQSLAEAQRIARLGSWEWDIETGACRGSAELYRIMGNPERDSLLRMEQFLERVHPEDCARVEQQLNQCRQTLQPFSLEHRIIRPDGSVRFVQEQGEAVLNGNKDAVSLTGTVLDITARREAEQEARKLQQAFDNSPIAIMITDLSGVIEYVNPCFTEMTGYTAAEICGQNQDILSTSGLTRSDYGEVWDTILAGQVWRGEFRNRKKSGELYWESATIAPVRDRQGKLVSLLGMKQDISSQKEIEQRLFSEANFSPLTGQPNRSNILSQIDHSIEEGNELALLLVDLINIKRINETLGMEAGDNLIIRSAERINGFAEPGYLVGHLGGGQFLLLLENPPELVVETLLTRLVSVFQAPFDLAGEVVHQGICIGVALFPDDAKSSQELLTDAHAAVTQAKRAGPYSSAYFSEQDNREAQSLLHMENQLRLALERGELSLYCQPKVDGNGACHSAEVLLRWTNPELGMVPPDRFIPLAEQTGLILDIGRWVIDESCRIARACQLAGNENFSLCVNMSPKQFLDSEISEFIADCLKKYSLQGRQIEIEVTEGLFLEAEEAIQQQINRLKSLGMTLALDDFGTGYSSLQYLRNYPFDTVKVDKSFVSGLPDSTEDASLVRAITAMAQALGLQVVAEGVEEPAQAEFLKQEGCDQLQGYLFAKPMPEEAFMQWLQQHDPAGL